MSRHNVPPEEFFFYSESPVVYFKEKSRIIPDFYKKITEYLMNDPQHVFVKSYVSIMKHIPKDKMNEVEAMFLENIDIFTDMFRMVFLKQYADIIETNIFSNDTILKIMSDDNARSTYRGV